MGGVAQEGSVYAMVYQRVGGWIGGCEHLGMCPPPPHLLQGLAPVVDGLPPLCGELVDADGVPGVGQGVDPVPPPPPDGYAVCSNASIS